jgi:crotonobetainyl-CoA:carnitine CoA-transferase CaiB-like acyl-CoA transferase
MTALKGIKVLDLSEEISGPFCSMQLSDGGAEVIKVEPIDGDWTRQLGEKIKGESSLFMSLNRGKKSIALNLHDSKGREIVLKLAKDADVLIESFGPGQAEKLGVGYSQLSPGNPGLVYCAISPFGTVGPYANLSASELEIQGMAGYQWFLGETGGEPVRLGVDIVGTTSGIWSFIGILSALFNRKATGKGQKIDSSQFLNMIMMYSYIITAHHNPDLPGGWHFTGPFDHQENGYKTADRALMFGMPIDAEKAQKGWEEFCRKVGLDELLEDPYFREKGMKMIGIGRDAQEFKPVIEPALENKTAAEIKAIVEGVGGYSAVFKNVEDILGEPQVAAVNMVQELDHPVAGKIKTIGIPWKLKDTALKMQGPPPTLGQHTEEILKAIGYGAKEISALKESKVVA